MNNDLEYYLNNQRSSCYVPTNKQQGCLSKQKFLSEFETEDEKKVAQQNLGVTEELDNLRSLINSKILEKGGCLWDPYPIQGHHDYVISSNNLYNEFQRTREYIDNSIQEVKDNDISEVWQDFYSRLEEINQNVTNTQTDLRDILRCMVKEEMVPFYLKYHALENDYKDLKHQFESFIQTSQNGTVISNNFGNSELITISQKTITEAFNNLYKRISDHLGEPDSRLQVIINPDYFIGENGCNVIININAPYDIMENVKVFFNGEVIVEQNNVKEYSHQCVINDTTNVKVEATILGKVYMEERVITKYYPFFIGGGQNWQDIVNPENVITFNGSVEGDYSVKIDNDGDRIFIIIPKSQQEDVRNIYMNGFDIPFNIEERDDFVVYTSVNSYRSNEQPYPVHIYKYDRH